MQAGGGFGCEQLLDCGTQLGCLDRLVQQRIAAGLRIAYALRIGVPGDQDHGRRADAPAERMHGLNAGNSIPEAVIRQDREPVSVQLERIRR